MFLWFTVRGNILSPILRRALTLICLGVHYTLTDLYLGLALCLALGLSIWLLAMGPWRVRRGEKKRNEGWKKGRRHQSWQRKCFTVILCASWSRGRTLTDAIHTHRQNALAHSGAEMNCATVPFSTYTHTFSAFTGCTYTCTFYPWTANEPHSLCHAMWGMRCVCVSDRQQSLSGYCGRLVGLVKMHVRKCRVTDVAFLLSLTNMVILPAPASLILHAHTHTCAQVQLL